MILLAMTLTSVYSLDNVISNVVTISWPSASPGVISGRWERVHLSVQSWDQSWQLPWPSTPPRYRCYSWSKWEKESGKLNVWKWLKWKLVKKWKLEISLRYWCCSWWWRVGKWKYWKCKSSWESLVKVESETNKKVKVVQKVKVVHELVLLLSMESW